MKLALFIVAAIAIPLLGVRGRSLRRCLECQLALAFAVAGLAAFGRVLRIDLDPYLALVAAGAMIVAIPLGFIAMAREVRWSANRAFLIAGIGYAAMIP